MGPSAIAAAVEAETWRKSRRVEDIGGLAFGLTSICRVEVARTTRISQGIMMCNTLLEDLTAAQSDLGPKADYNLYSSP
jgi:hypothetical protein